MNRRIAIIGAGANGAGIAAMLSGKGYNVQVITEPAKPRITLTEDAERQEWNARVEAVKAAKRRAKGRK